MIKNYTFKLPKKTSNNVINANNSYNDSVNYLKTIVANNLTNKYPTIFTTTGNDTYFSTYSSTPVTLNWNYESDYEKAIKIIDSYGKKYYGTFDKDEYDFEINGVPVRIFSDMIQIGYKMYSKHIDSAYYINLPSTTKKTVIDIAIHITKKYNF